MREEDEVPSECVWRCGCSVMCEDTAGPARMPRLISAYVGACVERLLLLSVCVRACSESSYSVCTRMLWLLSGCALRSRSFRVHDFFFLYEVYVILFHVFMRDDALASCVCMCVFKDAGDFVCLCLSCT